MRLLLLDQFSDPGGAQQGLLELLPSIKARGWSAVVGLPGCGELFERIREFGFQAAKVACGPYRSVNKSPGDALRFALQTPQLATQVRKLARQSGAQVIYVNGPRLLPGVALAGLDVPVVFHSHSYIFPGMVRRLSQWALRRANAWIVGSCRFVAEPWRECAPPERQVVIYNGVAGPSDVGRKLHRPPTVACIGRIAPEKGMLEFVEAASIVRRSIPDCKFTVYGAALFSEAGVQRYDVAVRAAGLGAGVEFRGWTSDIYAALAEIDLLLVPSASHEATTRVILEAHGAGVPVIAFRSGGIPEVVEHGQDGWLVDSTEEMARRAVEILRLSPDDLASVSRRARQTWERKFTLQRYHNELLETLSRARP